MIIMPSIQAIIETEKAHTNGICRGCTVYSRKVKSKE